MKLFLKQMQGTVYANYSHYHNFRHACVTIAKKEGLFFRPKRKEIFLLLPSTFIH